jgi:hypothetical protein
MCFTSSTWQLPLSFADYAVVVLALLLVLLLQCEAALGGAAGG